MIEGGDKPGKCGSWKDRKNRWEKLASFKAQDFKGAKQHDSKADAKEAASRKERENGITWREG